MKKIDWKLVWEAVKEPLRLLVLSILPLLLVYFASLPYEWAAVILLVLRFIDKYLHESGIAEKGITRF